MDTTFKKTIKIAELRNDENIGGADVAIPLDAVDEGGQEQVLENGPWLIRLIPIILNKWMPNARLKEDEITVAPVWALVDSLVVAIPFQNGSGYSMETIDIEYEWQPPRCATCKIFDHKDEQCPKQANDANPTQVSDDGFVEVTRKNGRGNHTSKPRHVDGVR
ncbi:zinc knuckle CX2CX4HX4C containing protein, partial [Tanacetum coccineum]